MRNRQDEEGISQIAVPGGQGWRKPDPSRATEICRCRSCGHEISIDEGQLCTTLRCPFCGKMSLEKEV